MAGNRDEWQEGKSNYQAFLLRCWHDSDLASSGEPDGPLDWRFTLVRLEDRSQSKCFASLEEMVVYLRGRLSQAGRDDTNSLADSGHQPRRSPDETTE